jgi:hypothetical protein
MRCCGKQSKEGARMNLTKKHIVCLVVCLMLVLVGAVAFANPQVTIINKSGHPLYVYDSDGKGTATPLTKLLTDATPFKLTLQSATGRKIWFAAGQLKALESRGVEADPFNPTNDGDVMFNFMEYTSNGSVYTIDNSYVDVFSYPITLMFSTTYKDVCQAYHEYGFTSFSAVAKALQSQGAPWSNLVWPNPSKKMYRIVGPNKIWPFKSANDIPPQAPANYRQFWNALPPNGTQLFNPVGNFDGWKQFYQDDGVAGHKEALLKTGYFKALLSAASPDKYGKHGFYISPKDSKAEFTNLPSSVQLTITVYPYEK